MSSSSMKTAIGIMVSCFVLIVIITLTFSPNNTTTTTMTVDPNHLMKTSSSSSSSSSHPEGYRIFSITNDNHIIQEDTIAVATGQQQHQAISFYHCHTNVTFLLDDNNQQPSSSSSEYTDDYNIVLLHGSAFTKRDWDTSGILSMLCYNATILQQTILSYHTNHRTSSTTTTLRIHVIAMDIDVTEHYSILINSLQELYRQHYISSLPVSAIVTPSASGTIVVNWIQSLIDSNNNNDNILEQIQKYSMAWIPIASFGIMSASNRVMQTIQDWSILSIHGDRDAKGKRTSERIQSYHHPIIELHGRHPCYLDSPYDFVITLYQYLFSDKK